MKLFDQIIGKKSASNAKERLRLVLINDRVNISPATLAELKDELIEVISKYIDIDPTMVNVDFNSDGRSQKLVADIPLRTNNKRH